MKVLKNNDQIKSLGPNFTENLYPHFQPIDIDLD